MILRDELKKNNKKIRLFNRNGIELFSAEDTLMTARVHMVEYKNDTTDITLDVYSICPNCGNPLVKSDLSEYKYLCEECDENFYGIEVTRYREKKVLIKSYERELKIIEAIWNKTISFSNDGEGDIVCHIGDYWFYFYEGKGDAWEITPENIHTHTEIMHLASMIRSAIEYLDDTEYGYYAAILGWEVA